MKKLFLFASLVALVFIVGCASPEPQGKPCPTPGRVMMGNFTIYNPEHRFQLEAISQASLPPKPVRKRSLFFRSLDGSYTYSSSQGTHNYVSTYWNEYGPSDIISQDTYSNVYENYTPNPRSYRVWTYHVQQPQPQQSRQPIRQAPAVIQEQEQVREQPQKKPCPDYIKMEPNPYFKPDSVK